MSSSNYLSSNLRFIMAEQGIDLKTLAKICQINYTTFSSVVTMGTGTTLRTLDKISKGLNIPSAQLIDSQFRRKL